MYPVIRRADYDFEGESYADSYPNLHKYPASMLPQIGIKILQELNIRNGSLFDPYCGSGSSFAAGLELGIQEMLGFDLNPLAILISQAKFTAINLDKAQSVLTKLGAKLYDNLSGDVPQLKFLNAEYWFAADVLKNLSIIHHHLQAINDKPIQKFFLVAFSETLRDVSYTRNGEFKLYRMPSKSMENFQPDVIASFLKKARENLEIYTEHYYPKLEKVHVSVSNVDFPMGRDCLDTVLTSPPYGDSRTTVAYGQFSRFANESMGISYARKLDNLLMGGKASERLYRTSLIWDAIAEIDKISHKRAQEVSAFYFDLEDSIASVARLIKKGGYAIYLVGNRRVKNIQLPTDQFIAEQFEKAGFKHCFTYERLIGNKVMPLENSPSNIKGETSSTMSQEFIVVCQKV